MKIKTNISILSGSSGQDNAKAMTYHEHFCLVIHGPYSRRWTVDVPVAWNSTANFTCWEFHGVSINNSKITVVKPDPERIHWGQTPFRVEDDPEVGQLSADLTNQWGQIDPALGHIPRLSHNLIIALLSTVR